MNKSSKLFVYTWYYNGLNLLFRFYKGNFIYIQTTYVINVYFNKVYVKMLRGVNGEVSVLCCNYLLIMISFLLWDLYIF